VSGCAGAPDENSSSSQPLRVTVVAVQHFARESGLENSTLSESIGLAASSIKEFFRKHYNVEPHVSSAPEQTTAECIRNTLNDLSNDSEKLIHIVFLISHGQQQNRPGSANDSQLLLAGSDASGSTISGQEIIQYLTQVRAGASVFLFIDACHSAAIKSLALQRWLDSQKNLNVHFMILASSQADKDSYNARFSRALIRLWERDDACRTFGSDIPEKLATELRDLASLEEPQPAQRMPAPEQLPVLVYPYGDGFCIEAFQADRALLLLVNPTFEAVSVTIRPLSGTTQKIQTAQVAGVQSFPIALRREQYAIEIARGSGKFRDTRFKTVDLGKQHVQTLLLDNVQVGVQAQRAVESAIEQAAESGATYEDINRISDEAKRMYRRAYAETNRNEQTAETRLKSSQQRLALATAKRTETQTVLRDREASVARVWNSIPEEYKAHPSPGEAIIGPPPLPPELRAKVDAAEAARSVAQTADKVAAGEVVRATQDTIRQQRARENAHAATESMTRVVQLGDTADRRRRLAQAARQQARTKSLKQLSSSFDAVESERGIILRLPSTDEQNLRSGVLDPDVQYQAKWRLLRQLIGTEKLNCEVELVRDPITAEGGAGRATNLSLMRTALIREGIPSQRLFVREVDARDGTAGASHTRIVLSGSTFGYEAHDR
jgi:hypothetical protein